MTAAESHKGATFADLLNRPKTFDEAFWGEGHQSREQTDWESAWSEHPSTGPALPVASISLEDETPLGRAALASEADRLRATQEGSRNHNLNVSAMRMGQLVAAGQLNAEHVRQELTAAARACGLREPEISKTFNSGMSKGLREPREIVERQNSANVTEVDGSEFYASAEDTPPATWSGVNLGRFLDGTYTAPTPSLLPRADGRHLLYAGLTHSLHGEPESGKSLIAQVETVRLLNAGGRVLYADFESDPASIVGRLLEFGADRDAIAERLAYVRPEAKPDSAMHEATAFRELLSQRYDLAVIDGVTDALSLWGAETKDNDGITRWSRGLPKTLADNTGAAVLMVDHVTKDGDSRGRFAIGGQAKLAALTGAAYTVEIAQPLGRGLRGVIVLRVAKDRPGQVRGHCSPMRPGDRTQEAARIVIDSTGDRPIVSVEPPKQGAPGVGNEVATAFRPTALMEKISRYVEGAHQPPSQRGINAGVPGKEDYKRTAIQVLVAEGYMRTADGPGRSLLHESLQPYRQVGDPLSDSYEAHLVSREAPELKSVPNAPASASVPYTGGREAPLNRLPGGTQEAPGGTQS